MINAEQRLKWQPPPRPEWVQRINEEGECMNISGVVPLDETSLLESAMRATGLSDFGADGWREPFRIFVKALEEEAELNLMGRLRTRSEILHLLEARLNVEDTIKRHPEILDERIVQPIVVVGQGRAGTSFLINVLAANPENGALQHWEAMFPCPPPEKAGYKNDPRIERCHKLITQWFRVTPTLEAVHEFGGKMPVESVVMWSMSFLGPSWLDALGQVPSYDAWVAQQDFTPALRYHERVLKLLQWKNPRKRWVLKDVSLLDHLEALLTVHPDALIVWPHRDPVRALASMVSAIGIVQWGRTEHALRGGSYEFFTDLTYSAQRLNAVVDRLEIGMVPPKQIHHLLYKDLVGDPMAAVEAMYRHFSIPLSEEGRRGIAQYLADNPRDARPPHRFKVGSEESLAYARQAFKRYQDKFKIPVE